jgi:hypothetical protein
MISRVLSELVIVIVTENMTIKSSFIDIYICILIEIRFYNIFSSWKNIKLDIFKQLIKNNK